ncbi:phage major capsid protein, P2 family [Novosphingobium rosa]|uniref:phage major capsid protein, P2 family n=1 Tax=Novosphingobium rosa TaxID=76978 RepID=UPI000ACFE466|nr:phage major capsid protein, P2 family [Novosphingobium rosa]
MTRVQAMQALSNGARAAWEGYTAQIAQLNRIDPARVGGAEAISFTVDPTPQQRLIQRMQEQSAFLGMINVPGVDELIGQTLGMDIVNSVASRANTDADERRKPIDPTSLDQFSYLLSPTEFNILYKYSKLDRWAKFPNFQTFMRDMTLKAMALDRIKIGFNGVRIDASFDPVADPTLAGMNKGWIQWMRENNSTRIMSAVPNGKVAGKVTIGVAGDYIDVDALVWDCIQEMLPVWARKDPNLVAIVGDDIIHDKYFPIINAPKDPMDRLATDVIMTDKKIGGKAAIRVPYLPAGMVIVTRLDNISLYYQLGAQRRMLRDEPQYNRVVDYNSSNEGYVLEDASYALMIENITVKNT